MDRSNDDPVDRSITGGSDFLHLDLTEVPVGGRTAWLTQTLQRAIADGRLSAGARLPASRLLAADLQVSRGVVTEAYARLADSGHVIGRGRGGTVVASGMSASACQSPGESAGGEMEPAVVFGSSGGARARAGGDLFEAVRSLPAEIDLTPGVPDLASFPRTAWLRAERGVLADLAPADFGYGDPRGAPALRGAVADWLARFRGITTEPDAVIIVAGVAQALSLLAQVLLREGVRDVAVEDPGSLGARQQLQNWGLATPAVPVDREGLVVEELVRASHPWLMATPAHQFPTGAVLSGERRRSLLRWLDGGGLMIEDDYDAEHRYDRAPVPALQGTAPEQVCYTGSVSKVLAPALRIGWLLPPRRYRDALIEAKRNADLGNAALAQLTLAALMRSGGLERHLRQVRRRHVRRRDAMLAALHEHLPQAVIHGASAGLHLMITLPGGVDDTSVAAAALTEGVKVQPLSWHRQRAGQPGLVLGYAAAAPPDIAAGIAAVGRAFGGVSADRGRPRGSKV